MYQCYQPSASCSLPRRDSASPAALGRSELAGGRGSVRVRGLTRTNLQPCPRVRRCWARVPSTTAAHHVPLARVRAGLEAQRALLLLSSGHDAQAGASGSWARGTACRLADLHREKIIIALRSRAQRFPAALRCLSGGESNDRLLLGLTRRAGAATNEAVARADISGECEASCGRVGERARGLRWLALPPQRRVQTKSPSPASDSPTDTA